jgi:predicted Zn-dependent protease
MKIWCLTLSILLINSFFIQPAYSEYNLATGEEETILISTEKEVQMGRSLSEQVENKIKPDTNYTNQERLDIIGQKLAEVCDRKNIVYHFKVLDDESENAFALPGGYIYIFKGLLEKLDNDDQVAGVLAHEIGHTCARHSMKRLQNSFGYEVLRFIVIRGANDSYTRYKANEAINQLMLSYSREDEFQADALAVKYLEKAGYRPEGMIEVLDKLIELQMEGPIRSKRYWHSHPYLAARRAAISKEVTGQIRFDDYINITPEEGYISPN